LQTGQHNACPEWWGNGRFAAGDGKGDGRRPGRMALPVQNSDSSVVDMHDSWGHTYHERYLTFVSSELGNVILHPREREFLIKEAEVVARGRKV